MSLAKHVKSIVQYAYEDEQRDFEETYDVDFKPDHIFTEDQKNHIFYHLHQASMAFMDYNSELETEHVIVLSIGHLTKETAAESFKGDPTYPWVTLDLYGGYYRVPSPDDLADGIATFTDDIRVCVEFGMKHHATLLRFDSDGPQVADLPLYNW